MPDPRDIRKYMKSDGWLEMRGGASDQQRGMPHPLVQRPYPEDAELIDLPAVDELDLGTMSVHDAIAQRRSRRRFSDVPLALAELAYLAWASQGVHRVWRGGIAIRRTVPSAGSRHPFETYLAVNRVEGLEAGLYRYLSLEHKLLQLRTDPDIAQKAAKACHEQAFVAGAAATFIWTALPYRTEWRYSIMAPKLVCIDAGHVCGSLYLAAESIGAGVCAIAAYEQAATDELLGVNGEEEFAVYVAPVGKV